jgi:hypothetical protein
LDDTIKSADVQGLEEEHGSCTDLTPFESKNYGRPDEIFHMHLDSLTSNIYNKLGRKSIKISLRLCVDLPWKVVQERLQRLELYYMLRLELGGSGLGYGFGIRCIEGLDVRCNVSADTRRCTSAGKKAGCGDRGGKGLDVG